MCTIVQTKLQTAGCLIQAPEVEKLEGAIHRIKRYPMDEYLSNG